MAKRKKPDGDDTSQTPNDSDENFGLPDIDPKPLERPESEQTIPVGESAPTVEASTNVTDTSEPEPFPPKQPRDSYRSTYAEPEPERSPAGIIITILLVIVLAGAGIWYFMMYKPKKDKEEAAARELALKRAEDKRKKDEEERLRLAEEERLKREAEAAQTQAGAFQILEERTGRYYVIIATAIDDDLLQDYASKLSATGISTKMIPPFGKTKFYRLAIEDFDTWASAQARADAVKGQYGDAVWVVKY